MSTLNPTGRYVLRSFHKGQQMNSPEWGWDDLDEIWAYAERLAADNGNTDCEWAVFDRHADAEIARVRPL
jgi:hypothetical protein